MSSIVSYILARLGEASTYAGVAALLGGFHISVPATTLGAVTRSASRLRARWPWSFRRRSPARLRS